MTTTTSNYQVVLEQVAHWPPPERLALVQDIIGTLAHELRAAAPRAATLPAALGLLTTDQLAPTDADVKRWLAEQGEEKY